MLSGAGSQSDATIKSPVYIFHPFTTTDGVHGSIDTTLPTIQKDLAAQFLRALKQSSMRIRAVDMPTWKISAFFFNPPERLEHKKLSASDGLANGRRRHTSMDSHTHCEQALSADTQRGSSHHAISSFANQQARCSTAQYIYQVLASVKS